MSEIEKQFFETFVIEPVYVQIYDTFPCYIDKKYPQITDRILLKLLSIQSYEKSYYTLSPFYSIDELKKDLLNEFIDGYTYNLYNDREDVKHQVQALFKEDNNE